MTPAERRVLVAVARAMTLWLERREDTGYRELAAAVEALEAEPPVVEAHTYDDLATCSRCGAEVFAAVADQHRCAVSETSQTSWPALCRAECRDGTPVPWYCTRLKGHEGEHIAAIGPYVQGDSFAPVLARWSATTPLPEKT